MKKRRFNYLDNLEARWWVHSANENRKDIQISINVNLYEKHTHTTHTNIIYINVTVNDNANCYTHTAIQSKNTKYIIKLINSNGHKIIS